MELQHHDARPTLIPFPRVYSLNPYVQCIVYGKSLGGNCTQNFVQTGLR